MTLSKTVAFRIDMNTLQYLDELAQKSNLKRGSLIKQLVYQKSQNIVIKPNFLNSKNYKEMIKQINKIGNNINQLAKNVNENNIRGNTTNNVKILETLVNIEQHLEAILEMKD